MRLSLSKWILGFLGLLLLVDPAHAQNSGSHRAAVNARTLDRLSATPELSTSTRLMRMGYSGACMRVRRSSDNTETDINYVNGEIDTSTLLTFCGVGSGYVVKWYDNSRGAKDVFNYTAANQPRIVNAGILESSGSRAAPNFLGSAGAILSVTNGVTVVAGGAYTVESVLQLRILTSPSQGRYFCGSNKNGGGVLDDVLHVGQRSDTQVTIAQWSDDANYTYAPTTEIRRHMASYKATGSEYWVENVSLGTSADPHNSLNITDPFSVGASYYSTFFGKQTTIDGWLPEFVAFRSAINSTDRASLSTSQYDYYFTVGSNIVSPLVHYSNLTTATNTTTVAAGAVLYDGLLDEIGTDFDINTGNLRQTVAGKHRLNHLTRPVGEAVDDQTIVAEFTSHAGAFVQLWARYNVAYAGGYRGWFGPGGGSVSCDRCINGTADQGPGEVAFSGGVPADGTAMIMEYRAVPEGSDTRCTVTVWKKSDWQSIPQGSPQATQNFLGNDATLDASGNPPGVSASIYSGTDSTIQNIWTYNNAAPTITAAQVPKTCTMGYLGSSTWANNTGSGTVPDQIDTLLAVAYPTSNVTTINDAVGGSTSTTWLPGTANNNVLKAHMQASSGYRVVRMMIGSNDASNGITLAAYKANMQVIIDDCRSWPVDMIIVEDIGVRLDGATTAAQLNLLYSYNIGRGTLRNVTIGSARTFDDQSKHLNLLGGDLIHQTDAGQVRLASQQALETVLY